MHLFLPPPVMESQTRIIVPSFYMGAWGPNSGPHSPSKLFYAYVWLPVWLYAHCMHVGNCGGQKRLSDPLQLGYRQL